MEEMGQEIIVGVWLPPIDWYEEDDSDEDIVP